MSDRFLGMRHDPVVAGDDEDDDVDRARSTRAHRGEGRVTRSVDDRDLVAELRRHLVGADVLGDPAGLVLGDTRLADRVDERGLAVVDVAEESHDRRAQLERFLADRAAALAHVLQVSFLGGDLVHDLELDAEDVGEELGGVLVDDRVLRQQPELLQHRGLDDHVGLQFQRLGELLNGDRRIDLDVRAVQGGVGDLVRPPTGAAWRPAPDRTAALAARLGCATGLSRRGAAAQETSRFTLAELCGGEVSARDSGTAQHRAVLVVGEGRLDLGGRILVTRAQTARLGPLLVLGGVGSLEVGGVDEAEDAALGPARSGWLQNFPVGSGWGRGGGRGCGGGRVGARAARLERFRDALVAQRLDGLFRGDLVRLILVLDQLSTFEDGFVLLGSGDLVMRGGMESRRRGFLRHGRRSGRHLEGGRPRVLFFERRLGARADLDLGFLLLDGTLAAFPGELFLLLLAQQQSAGLGVFLGLDLRSHRSNAVGFEEAARLQHLELVERGHVALGLAEAEIPELRRQVLALHFVELG